MAENREHTTHDLHLESPSMHSDPFLPLLPLKNVVILPKSIIPIIVGRPSSIEAVEYALKKDKTIFITAQKDFNIESPNEKDVFVYGTRSIILQVVRMPNGALKILAEGICRAKILQTELVQGFLGVYYEDLPSTNAYDSIELQATWRQLKSLYHSYADLNDKVPIDLANSAMGAHDFDHITDTMAVHVNLSLQERQIILELTDLRKRMLKLCFFLTREIEILHTEQKIKSRVQNQVEKGQREYYLNEQMKAIQKELGKEDHKAEIEVLRAQAHTACLPEDALEKVEKELKRLEQMPTLSSEAVVSRNYIDWIITLPWNTATKDTFSLTNAEKLLNKHHAGLIKAKERILEFLAAKKFSHSLKRSPIICLVGPPGVGKTSLAQSVAQSLGRTFVRISLGGVKDEAEIRGHRRTYIGALPGKIIQAMKKAKTTNPVILLDEIDKMSQDLHGDPASALLEVLDPEQNKGFLDHFLDTEYDLSNVMFITTANMLEGIPYPLFDRMEVISLSGYTDQEKLLISKKFLIPKNIAEYGLKKNQFKISTQVLMTIIQHYTKEAGVRQLERVLTKLMRKVIQVLLKDKKISSVSVTDARILEWLGYPKFRKTSLNQRKNKVGIATGLAWTELGGDVLEIETTAIKGKGGLTLTGQLGDIMQESAQAALSYIRSRAATFGLKDSFYTSKDLHLHLPEGATPKDGPSAGITICSALISILTGKAVKDNIAMTGEITLQGRVLAVGGLKEKILAAQQHGITHIIVPHENKSDIAEIAKEIDLSTSTITYAKTMDDVIKGVFPLNSFKKVYLKRTTRKKKRKNL
jgi:ATP-dependent Lon protease